jgi:hypothetical protein
MRIILVSIVFFFAVSPVFALTNTYADYFRLLGMAQSNVLIQALESEDLDMVYSAIHRIGELGCTNAKKNIWAWLAQANPAANAGKVQQETSLKEILRASVWAISRIGDDTDAQELVTYAKDIKKDDHETIREIIHALGAIRPSAAGLSFLNRLTREISDERDAEELLLAISNQNFQSSANYLIVMSKNVSFSEGFREKLEKAATDLALKGN